MATPTGVTYLVTNEAQAADLLDLVIQRDGPDVEPFFTDTLGSEIFGQARSTEPEPYEDEYEEYEEEPRQSLRDRLNKLDLPKLGKDAPEGTAKARSDASRRRRLRHRSRCRSGRAAASAGATRRRRPRRRPHLRRQPRRQHPFRGRFRRPGRPAAELPVEKPKVSWWRRTTRSARGRSGRHVPAAARTSNVADADDDEYDDYDDEEQQPEVVELLVGGLLAVLLVIAHRRGGQPIQCLRGGWVAMRPETEVKPAPASESGRNRCGNGIGRGR